MRDFHGGQHKVVRFAPTDCCVAASSPMLAAISSAVSGMALNVTSPSGGHYLSPSPPFQPLGNARDPRSAVLPRDHFEEDDRHVFSGMSGRFDGEDEMLNNLAIMGEESEYNGAGVPLYEEDYTISTILPTDFDVPAF